jgi:nucleoside 2-deoxyribosyltransferase
VSRAHPVVYLAGPIGGLTFDQADGWRQIAATYLAEAGITTLSPLRGKNPTEFGGQPLRGDNAYYRRITQELSQPAAIVGRDYFDASTCDLMLVNLTVGRQGLVSIGTVFEIGVAYSHSIPIVLVRDPLDTTHDHIFITETATFKATSLVDGVDLAIAILEPTARRRRALPESVLGTIEPR